MGDFDYSKDIAPLRGQFFSNPRMTDRERAGLRGRFATEIAPLMEVHDKLNEAERNKRQDDLSYQRGLLELRQAKRSAREEREALTVLPEVVAALDTAFGDPKATTVTKARAIADTTARYAPHIAKNPALSQAIAGFSGRLGVEDDADASRMETRKAKKSAAEQRAYDRANRLSAAYVDNDVVRKTLLEGGVSEEAAQDYVDDIEMGRASLTKREQEARAMNVQVGTQEAVSKAFGSKVEEFNEYLNGLEQARIGDEEGAPEGEYSLDTKSERPFTLRKEDRRRIVAALKGLHQMDPAKLPTSDEELFDLALEKKYSLTNSPMGPPNTTASDFSE